MRGYTHPGSGLLPKIESGTVQHYHPDQLSVRMMTHSTRPPRRTRSGQADSSGNVIGQQGHYPFGEPWYQTNTTTKWFFTAGVHPDRSRKERDAESGNDYASFRYGVYRLGRFASPDPVTGSPTNPQSPNRYAYVLNDPVSHVDPLGLDCNWTNPDEPCNGGSGDGAPVFADWSITRLDSGYLVDGFIPVSGSLAQSLLQSGAGFVCPDSGCPSANAPAGDQPLVQANGQVEAPPYQPPGTTVDMVIYGVTGWGVGQAWTTLGQLLADPFGTGGGGTPPTVPTDPQRPPQPPVPPAPSKIGPAPPGIGPDPLGCSSYLDGTGAGDALFKICANTPNGPYANCVRGKLLNQYLPNGNPLQLVFYLIPDHAYDFAVCSANFFK